MNESDIDLLQRVGAGMAILADVSRSDVLLYCPGASDKAVVAAHAQPHSVSPVYADPLTGAWVDEERQPLVFRALRRQMTLLSRRSGVADGAPVVQQVLPVSNRQGRVLAALCVETNLIEHERQRRRHKAFQWAVRQLQHMAARGELADASSLTPFGEHDGIILVDRHQVVRYASGIATNLYRRLGLVEGLVGKRLSELGTQDAEIAAPVFDGSHYVQQETHEGGRSWIKRGVPVLAVIEGWSWWSVFEPFLVNNVERRRVLACMILIRDTTESQRKEQEIKVKTALIREVHHRVKNNLQTIAALLRMQARRSESEETRQALQEGINRILSVAVVHEFLAHEEANAVSLRDVATKIVRQIRQGVVGPEQHITITLEGDDVLLPSQQATSCALIINELLLNSIQHGFQDQRTGRITVTIGMENGVIRLLVQDNGLGLPADFDLNTAGNLGLQIVRTLVQDDLQGTFSLESDGDGTRAVISFPKRFAGGA